MKKVINIALTSFFSISYATFLGLGMKCFFTLCIIFLFENKPMMEAHPRLYPFCIIVGLSALIALFLLFVLNLFIARELKSTVITWIIEIACSLALSIPMLVFWNMVIEYLRMIY